MVSKKDLAAMDPLRVPSTYFTVVAEKERTRRQKAIHRHEREMYERSANDRLADYRLRMYSARNSRLASASETVRTGMGLFSFFKPAIVFMLLVILFLGVGFRSLGVIIRSVGWWWLLIVVLAVYFVKYR